MRYLGEEKPSLDNLAHFGVKGMKWGVRNSQPISSGYSQSNQVRDARTFGKGGVKRINERLHKGKTYPQAVRRELALSYGKGVLVAGIAVTPIILKEYGPTLAQSISDRAETNRGRNSLKGIMAKEKPLAAKKNRKGVYKVTTI